SILHDWQGDAESTFTKGGQTKRISEELGDTWLEYGVGANFNATKNLHLYADLEATEGAKVETSYRFNLGARWSF
ncbi:MAG: autotransporter outer membrane beta-barrel domain-containing protein, partial [Sutterella sp.]|nr:autotransporter outer membrane beta-barrel domain-containing protein [Sutterella sp.]